MNRFRLVALAIVLATAMLPGQAAVAQLASAAPSLHAALPTFAGTWSLIRQWFGGTQPNCGPTIDPGGGCAGSAPQPAPPRVQCGHTGDPAGGCTGALPQRPAAARAGQSLRHG
jgi:hypothetical protein